ncbi:hypothetical protein X943_000494 [Babesia divergens]|uniref:RAP domain-containing protein n=1 Tax=Babesia divergens TaxID=32595 RepID=A0AAD9GH57_BABDI|nr:hypothetical protein X943_000494 [Babesia divergens]
MSHITHLLKCLARKHYRQQISAGVSGPPPGGLAPRLYGNVRFHSATAAAGVAKHSSAVENISEALGAIPQSPTEAGREATTVYVNELCMQMDQLMFSCKDHEDLLVLLVTHRGAMYLHNLVTAIRLLQAFAEQDRERTHRPDADDLFAGYKDVFAADGNGSKQGNVDGKCNNDGGCSQGDHDDDPKMTTEAGKDDLEGLTETQKEIVKRAKEEILIHFENPANQQYLNTNHSRPVAEAIVRDERYDLLMHDLYANRNKLDIESACHVIIALDSLQHKYFRLYNGILRHLMRLPLDSAHPEIAKRNGKLLLKTCHCYVKAGFYDIPLYSKVCREIYKRPIEHQVQDIDTETLMETLKLFANVDVYDPGVFANAASLVYALPLTPNDISHVAFAYAAHNNYTRLHDDILAWVARQIQERPSSFSTMQLARCVYSFAKMRLYFSGAYNALIQRLTDELEISTKSYATTTLTVPQMALLVERVANFLPEAAATKKLVRNLMTYLEELIDKIDETSAINIAFAVCATDSHDLNKYMASFLWRIIGRGTDWERHKYRVFAIWIFQVIKFPELNVNIPKRCVTAGMREWLLRHGNGPQFPNEFDEIVHILQHDLELANVTHEDKSTGDIDEVEREAVDVISAFPSIDIKANGKMLKIIMNEMNCRNNPANPIGVDLVVQNLIRESGQLIHSINFQHWGSMTRKEKVQYLKDVLQDM